MICLITFIDDGKKMIVRTVFIRFYEELNDYLPEQHRKISFPYQFTGKPLIKEIIEAVGVPISEIDLITINGESVDFDQQVQGGEHVCVYPVFESLDITAIARLRSKPLRKTKFIADGNLSGLANSLQLLGYDTLCKSDFTYNQIVDLSLEQKRIILTRNKEILQYRSVTHCYYVRSNNPKEQLKEVVNRLQLE